MMPFPRKRESDAPSAQDFCLHRNDLGIRQDLHFAGMAACFAAAMPIAFTAAAFLFYTASMICGLRGLLVSYKPPFAVIDVNGVYCKVAVPPSASLPLVGGETKLFTYLAVRENALELYGFVREVDLTFFERLLSVSGVGPKSALAIMAVASAEELAAAVSEGKADLLTRVSGIGRKTAERVVLELKDKLPAVGSEKTVQQLERDQELAETLAALGYSQTEIKKAVAAVKNKEGRLEERLKEALRSVKT